MKKVYAETYGCTFNIADTEYVLELLRSRGFKETEDINDADLIIVNTCVVRLDTERNMIKKLSSLKNFVRLGKRVIVMGCMVPSMPSKIIRILPEADLIGPSEIYRVHEVVEMKDRLRYLGCSNRKLDVIPRYREGVTYVLPIASGCLGDCSFCIVKIARGKLKSYDPRSIYLAFYDAIHRGAKEVYLTAQDTGAYGYDIGFRLPSLLNMLLKVSGEYRIRIGMYNPMSIKDIIDDLISIYKDPKVYKFSHLPVQSGDDNILKLMKRPYTVNEFIEIINRLRDAIPRIQIATDIIVGFPFESDEAFENTVKLIERVKPDKIHIARYTMRPHTEAASWKQISDDIKKRRSKYLSELAQKIGLEINSKFLGEEVRVLVTKTSFRGELEARTDEYRAVIIKEKIDSPEKFLGKFKFVEIIEARPFYLLGRFI